MHWKLLAPALLAAAGMGSAGSAATGPQPAAVLTTVVTEIPAGKVWIAIQNGPFCATVKSERSDGRQLHGDLKLYRPPFDEFFGPKDENGFKRTDLFDRSNNQSSGDYQVGALIKDADIKSCAQGVLGVKNDSSMSIEWQIYSTALGKVVATIRTTGEGHFKSSNVDAINSNRLAFMENARRLYESPQMQALLAPSAPQGQTTGAVNPEGHIAARGATPGVRAIADEVGSGVVVSLGDSSGSGVLISPDGYILTNEHVVGRAKAVRIRWSDGFEGAGEVLRTHAKRDVALIKADPHGRDAVPVRSSAPQPGDTVFAIGEPLGFQNTVTRGVVSTSNRIVDGFRFIQSDVVTNHGNSGGPLLDEKGQLVALTDFGIQPGENVQIGQNFFIPIKDALDFLGIDLTTLPSRPPPEQSASAPAAKSASKP